MTTYKVGYFVGSLAKASINRKLAKALAKGVNRHIALSTSHSQFFAGPFLDDTGPGDDMDYFTVDGTYKF